MTRETPPVSFGPPPARPRLARPAPVSGADVGRTGRHRPERPPGPRRPAGRPGDSTAAENPLAPGRPISRAGAAGGPALLRGGISHLDTWDYKPELIKRHDQPMPGVEKLITFLGENGNLIKSPWAFRPRGETGKMVSDLLPATGRADRRTLLHPLDDVEDEHARAGGDLPAHRVHAPKGSPASAPGSRTPWGPRTRTFPRSWRSPTPAGSRSKGRRATQRLPAGRLPGDGVQRRQADPPPQPPGRRLRRRGRR